MKRFLLLGAVVVLLGGGIFAYFQFGGSPEAKRERSLKAARAYLEQSKVNEAIVEFRNALKADPASAEAHYEFGMALMRQGDLRSAYREIVRAADLKPNFYQARYQLALFHLLSKDIKKANRRTTEDEGNQP